VAIEGMRVPGCAQLDDDTKTDNPRVHPGFLEPTSVPGSEPRHPGPRSLGHAA